MTLRLRLLLLLGVAWLTLGGAVTAWMYHRTSAQFESVLDSRLAASASMVGRLASELPELQGGTGRDPNLPAGALPRGGVACELSQMRGTMLVRVIARTPGSPRLHDVAAGFGSLIQDGVAWRTYVRQEGAFHIAVADRMDLRESLRREVAWAAVLPLLVCFLAGLPLLWIGISKGLAPLERLRGSLSSEGPVDRVIMPAGKVPRDLAPFTRTISLLLERVKVALQRERRFADNAAHEMRTPLTVVKTHLQVLQRLLGDHPDPMAREALTNAAAGTERLRRLLDQLLELARVENDVQALVAGEPAEASAAVRTVLEELPSGRIRIQMPPGPVFVAVPAALLVSALRNLLDNAMKYSAPDLPVHLIVRVTDGTVEFRVLDAGEGLPEAALERALEPFWRGGQTPAGSGLGLAIVASISQRFNGSFSLANAPGGGLDCRLRLGISE
ncbi:ATP-binding protein [Achromobacter anxifer]